MNLNLQHRVGYYLPKRHYTDKYGDKMQTWLGWQWYYGPSRWVQRVWNALPLVVLILILWRVW